MACGEGRNLQNDFFRCRLDLIDSCITQLKAQGPSRTCNESKEEEEAGEGRNLENGFFLARQYTYVYTCIQVTSYMCIRR